MMKVPAFSAWNGLELQVQTRHRMRCARFQFTSFYHGIRAGYAALWVCSIGHMQVIIMGLPVVLGRVHPTSENSQMISIDSRCVDAVVPQGNGSIGCSRWCSPMGLLISHLSWTYGDIHLYNGIVVSQLAWYCWYLRYNIDQPLLVQRCCRSLPEVCWRPWRSTAAPCCPMAPQAERHGWAMRMMGFLRWNKSVGSPKV